MDDADETTLHFTYFISADFAWTRFLSELHRLSIPGGWQLTEYLPPAPGADTGELAITGSDQDSADLIEFESSLEALPGVTGCEIQ